MTTTDLDQSGTWQQSENIYFGPTLGYVRMINVPTTVTTTPYSVPPFVFQPPNINVGTYLINVAGVATINLPPAAGRMGYPVSISDISGNAFNNHITIVPNGVETIMGQASIFIGTNYGNYMLYPILTGGWYTL